MKKFVCLFLLLTIPAYAAEIKMSKNQILDNVTNKPIPNAKITFPKENITTYTDSNGIFNLDATINDTSIMSVEKEGYRPYSVTVNDKVAVHPLVIGIEKSNVQDIVISSEMLHLGDDVFSENSANSGEFKGKSIGPFYSKMFEIGQNIVNKKNYLVIGSIIGIDTLLARTLNQNGITNSFASPPEVYFNGKKIAEIQLNGDGQRIRLPNNLVRTGMNEITIHTGHNLHQISHVDYDDIEIMNLSIISE